MKLNPLGSKLVVIPEPITEKKYGKLIMPETVTSLTSKNIRAKVVAVGPGARNQKTGKRSVPLEVEPGDTVMLAKYAGSRIFVDNQEVMLIDISEILVVETA